MKKNTKLLLSVTKFIVSHFPMWEAFATLMLLGEYEEKGSIKLGLSRSTVLIDMAILTSLGSFMSFSKGLQSTSSILSSLYILARSLVEYQMNYGVDRELAAHLLVRLIGCVAAHLTRSLELDKKPANKRSALFSFTCLAYTFTIFGQIMLTWASKLERKLLISFFKAIHLNSASMSAFMINAVLLLLMINLSVFAFHKSSIKESSWFMTIFYIAVQMPIDVFILNIPLHWFFWRVLVADFCTISGLIMMSFSL